MFRKYNKFKNKKVKLDGYTFDSQAEAKHYQHTLKPKFEKGIISHLQVHPRITCMVNNVKVCVYIADFSYIDQEEPTPLGAVGCLVYEDVKGFKTDVYKLKKKLVEACYKGTKVVEIDPKLYRNVELITDGK